MVMLKKPLAFICLLITASYFSKAQVNVYIGNSDSIHTAVSNLFKELGRAGFSNKEIQPATAYKGDGLILLETKDAEKYGIPVPKTLKQFRSEGIYIKGTSHSLLIIGNSGLAVQEAIYFYLEQLGYRYFLPGDEWIIVPKLNSVYKNFELLTQPDFEFRTIANGHGFLNIKKPQDDFYQWFQANRMGGAFNIWLGHNYEGIVAAREEEFKNHPEYFAPQPAKGTIPVSPKFNIANKDLVKLVTDVAIKDIEAQVKRNASPVFFSMESSDGNGYCTSPECMAIGNNASDQFFYLTNEVAKAARRYPGAWIGSYAYNEHIVPTKYKLEPNIFVMVTNGFNRSKYTTYQLLQMWKTKVSKLGVYDYPSVYEWDMDMPGRVVAAKTDYIKESVRLFYKYGARAYNGETTSGWISKGLGQYLLSKLLWNTNVNTDSLKNDFYLKAFESGAAPMRKLFEAWENYSYQVPFDDDLATWHSLINEAYLATTNISVRKRIDLVKVYLHYVVLYTELQSNRTESNMMKTLSYAWRSKELSAFAAIPSMVSLPNYSGFSSLAYYNSTNQKWKENNTLLTSEEIQQNFREDSKKFKKTEGITFYKTADSFVPLDEVTPINKKFWEAPHTLWGAGEYIIQIKNKGADNYFEMSSGFAANPEVDRNVAVDFYPVGKEKSEPILHLEQVKKTETEKFSLAALNPGFYSVDVNDQRKMFLLKFSKNIKYSIVIKQGTTLLTTSAGGLNHFYFYVPPGTKRFRIAKSVVLSLQSPSGRQINYENNLTQTLYIDVLPGEEGIWTLYNQAGSFSIDGIPPYLGSIPDRMLLPAYLKNKKMN
jgi:hypothetical protein